MEKLSPEQRHALTTFVKQIRELLRMCSHGGVPIEADEFMEQNLTPGRLLAVERLFQEPDDTTVSGYCCPVRFPGSVVQDCNPFVRELAARWIPYHQGEASPSDVAFLTPEQEQNESFAFRMLTQYAAVLENVLKSDQGTQAATVGLIPYEPTGPTSELFIRGQLAVLRLNHQHKNGTSQEYLSQLGDDEAGVILQFLKRLGWWIPESSTPAQERVIFWLFRDDQTRLDYVGEQEVQRVVTPDDRLKDAIDGVEIIGAGLTFPHTCCLSILRYVRRLLDATGRRSPPLFPRAKREWPNQLTPANSDDAFPNVTNDPFWLEMARFDEFCFRFDGTLINAELMAAAEKIKLPASPLSLPETTGESWNDELYVSRELVRWLESWRDALKRTAAERKELPSGWEPRESEWPDSRIQSPEHLREWLKAWLNGIHQARASIFNNAESYLDDVRRELRNTRRAAREWGLSLPDGFNQTPGDIHEAETQLENLIDGWPIDNRSAPIKATPEHVAEMNAAAAEIWLNAADTLEQLAWIEGEKSPFPEYLEFCPEAFKAWRACHAAVWKLPRDGKPNSIERHLQNVFSAVVTLPRPAGHVNGEIIERWDNPPKGPWVSQFDISRLRIQAKILAAAGRKSAKDEAEKMPAAVKSGPKQYQTPCPHCGELVYVLAQECVHCRGTLRFNPAVQQGSLEAYRILTGWKPPKLEPPKEQPRNTVDVSGDPQSKEENTPSGAPQFKKSPPNDPDIMMFLKAFRRTWTPERDITKFCKEYAEKNYTNDKKAAKRLRGYVYRYLRMNR
jgi:hypothetical protein